MIQYITFREMYATNFMSLLKTFREIYIANELYSRMYITYKRS